MKKTNYSRPAMVGLFIFAGLVIIVLGVFTVGSQRKVFEKKFTLKAVFNDINGLQPGNNIWLSGMKVGTVRKIDFYSDTKLEVIMSIESKAQSHTYRNAKVKISTDGFIGNKIVVIYSGDPASGVVQNGDYLKTESTVSMDDMLGTLQISNRNLQIITENFRKVSTEIANGQGTVGGLIGDASLLNSLHNTIANLQRASSKTNGVMSNVHDFSSRLASQNGLVNQLLTDTLTFENIRQTVEQLKNSAATVSFFVEDLHKAGSNINESDNTVGVLLQDTKVANQLRAIITNLESSSRKLDEDLEALQHNFLLRGFFKKKAVKDKAGL